MRSLNAECELRIAGSACKVIVKHTAVAKGPRKCRATGRCHFGMHQWAMHHLAMRRLAMRKLARASVLNRPGLTPSEKSDGWLGVSLWKAGLRVQCDRRPAEIVSEHVEGISGAYQRAAS